MKVEKDIMVPWGYGKFFRSEKIMGLEPVEEGRGPGNRTPERPAARRRAAQRGLDIQRRMG